MSPMSDRDEQPVAGRERRPLVGHLHEPVQERFDDRVGGLVLQHVHRAVDELLSRELPVRQQPPGGGDRERATHGTREVAAAGQQGNAAGLRRGRCRKKENSRNPGSLHPFTQTPSHLQHDIVIHWRNSTFIILPQ